MSKLSDYAWLVGEEAAAYLDLMADCPLPALQQLGALRQGMSAEHARLVVEQLELRRRAAAKFGELARQMYFTPVLLEQATDLCVAGYKATRYMPFGEDLLVHDYCCGVGGDMVMLATRGHYIGWDISDVACLLAKANLEILDSDGAVRQADVSELTPAVDEMWHVDPDRRAEGGRSTTLERHSPGPETIDRWLQTSPNGAVKLAPATEPPGHWLPRAELEWISSGRECRQLVAWFGRLAMAPGLRRATKLTAQALGGRLAGSITGMPNALCDAVDAPAQYLFDPDPSVLAAKLLGELAVKEGLATLGAGGAYLTGDQPIDHPLLQAFAIQDCLPLRTPAIAQHLAARGVGRVEIKKRGVTVAPEKLRRELKLRGASEATVVLTRIGKRQVAIIADRLPATQG